MKISTRHKLAGFFLLFPFLIAAIICLNVGFSKLQHLRELERVPDTKAGIIIEGETSLRARASVKSETVPSKYTSTPSLYFRYLHEEEYRDSDGDRRWRTVDSASGSVEFFLSDDTGQVTVDPRGQNEINWRARQRVQETKGGHRYTEWRIEPGDMVYVFGLAKVEGHNKTIVFNLPGNYSPVVSSFERMETQGAMGSKAIIFLWLGLSAVSIACYGLVLILGIHRVLVFLSLVTFVQSATLIHLSMKMMRNDLSAGIQRYERTVSATEESVQRYFVNPDRKADGIIDINKAYQKVSTLNHHNAQMAREYILLTSLNYHYLRRQMMAVPERYLLPIWRFAKVRDPIQLSPNDEAEIKARLQALPRTRLTGWWTLISVYGGMAAFLMFSFFAVKSIRTKRMIENIPCTKTPGISCGLSETTGVLTRADDKDFLQSPLSKSACSWFHYKVLKKTRSGKKTRWVTVEDYTKGQDFLLKDSEGAVLVRPHKAEIITRHKNSRRRGSYRYIERLLKPKDEIYVLGTAAIDKHKSHRLVIQEDSQDMRLPFILSNYREKEVMLSKAGHGMALFLLAFIALLLAGLVGFGRSGGFAATDLLASAACSSVFLITLMFILHYNDLVFLRGRALRNLSNIEVALKKRHNIFNYLEKITQQFLKHEQELQTYIASARNSLKNAIAEKDLLESYWKSEAELFRQSKITLEAHPDLKGNSMVRRAMQNITRMENEIAFIRKSYNDATELYNARISSFPDMFFARLGGFKPLDYIA